MARDTCVPVGPCAVHDRELECCHTPPHPATLASPNALSYSVTPEAGLQGTPYWAAPLVSADGTSPAGAMRVRKSSLRAVPSTSPDEKPATLFPRHMSPVQHTLTLSAPATHTHPSHLHHNRQPQAPAAPPPPPCCTPVGPLPALMPTSCVRWTARGVCC